jgi:serine/threonine protein kinase
MGGQGIVAQLIRAGDFVGPGEQLTASRLEADLPSSWVVIANKVMVGRDGSTRELDFVIVGENCVFVVDEKNWHGPIRGDDKGWVMSGGDSLRSPISKMEMAARRLAGSLKSNVPRLQATLLERPFVHARIILSADDVACQVQDPRASSQVLRLQQAPDELEYFDRHADKRASIEPFRNKIIEELTRLRDRPRIPSRVADYEVLEVVQDRGASFTLVARHDDGAVRLLQVLDRRVTEVAELAEKDRLGKLREYEALRRLSELGRAPAVAPYFSWREDEYWVVPVDIIPGSSLRSLRVTKGAPGRVEASSAAADAFRGLADVHEVGILHRGLSPDTVIVDNGRVRFTDFSLAHLPDTMSLVGNVEPRSAEAFVAPETRVGFGFAEARSDVYSLAASISYWLTGIEPPIDEAWASEPMLRAAAETAFGSNVADTFGRCLAKDERDRPTAAEMALALQVEATDVANAQSVFAAPAVTRRELAPGDELEGRYTIESVLGRGATGVSYLATDSLINRRVVLKTLLNPELVRALAANEFNMLAGLAHPGLQKVYDVRPPDAPFHLKFEHILGTVLTSPVASGSAAGDPELATRVALEIGDVLRYLEERGLVHRDISRANVLIPEDSRPAVLLDFGLAALSRSLTAVGTARYRDPAVEHGEPWTPAADRYSLGVLVFEIAVGRLPYDESGPAADKSCVVELTDGERGRLPRYLSDAIRRAVSPDPVDRFASAAEFVAAFVRPTDLEVQAGAAATSPARRESRRIVANRFVLVPETLVTGGVADVYQAVDLEDPSQPVAVKLIRETPDRDRMSDLFFSRELASLRDLRHPNVVRLLAGGREADTLQYYLALEWVPQTLTQFLEKRSDVEWDWFCQVVALPLARALGAAHERQIIHRDVKPSNILVAADGTVKLADFGISVLKTQLPDGSRTLANYGSAPYAPPEHEYLSDAVRDTFALGVVAIEALAGHRLADYGDIAPALESLKIPERAYELLRRCVSFDPADRPLNGLVLEVLLLAASRSEPKGDEAHVSDIHCVVRGRLLNDQTSSAALQAGFGTSSEFIAHDLSDGAYARRAPVTDEAADPHIFLYGQLWSYRAAVQASPPELLLISGRQEPAAQLDRERERSVFVPRHFAVGVPVTNYDGAESAIRGLLDLIDVHEDHQQDDALEREDRSIFTQWLAQLRASEALEASREGALQVSGVRREGGVITCMLEVEPAEDIAGQNRVLRSLDGHGKRFQVVVGECRGRTLELWLEPGIDDDPPRSGILAIDTGPSSIALKRQRDALNVVRFRGAESRRSDLPALLLHPETAAQASEVPVSRWINLALDDDKRLAVALALGSPDFMLVQGPPGTGKTTLIAELVGQELRRNPDARILLTSQGHVALDNALVALRTKLPDAFRLTRLATSAGLVAEDVRDLLLERQAPLWRREIRRRSENYLSDFAARQGLRAEDVKAALHLGQLRGLRTALDEAAGALAIAHQALADVDREKAADADASPDTSADLQADLADREKRVRDLDRQISDLAAELAPLLALPKSEVGRFTSKRIDELSSSLLAGDSKKSSLLGGLVTLQGQWLERVGRGAEFDEALLRSSHVVAATCVGLAGFPAAQDLAFDLCILDEASKAMATESLVPFVRSSRWVLVGDQQQLPPFQEHALLDPVLQAEYGLDEAALSQTLFDLLWSRLPSTNKVALRQQHRMVREIGDLISHVFYGGSLVSRRTDGLSGVEVPLPKPVTWFDTKGLPDRREKPAGIGNKSFVNAAEARTVASFLRRLAYVLPRKRRAADLSVLVLAPYRPQVTLIEEHVARVADALHGLKVEVRTVDAAQGREADIVVFSVTRSNDSGRAGFLQERRRINVALSRARFGLAIVGDSSFCCSQSGSLSKALEYIRDNPEDCAMMVEDDE